MNCTDSVSLVAHNLPERYFTMTQSRPRRIRFIHWSGTVHGEWRIKPQQIDTSTKKNPHTAEPTVCSDAGIFHRATPPFDGRSSSEPGSRHSTRDEALLSVPEPQKTYETSARPQSRHRMLRLLGLVAATLALISIPIGPQFWTGLKEQIDWLEQLQSKLIDDDRASDQPSSNLEPGTHRTINQDKTNIERSITGLVRSAAIQSATTLPKPDPSPNQKMEPTATAVQLFEPRPKAP